MSQTMKRKWDTTARSESSAISASTGSRGSLIDRIHERIDAIVFIAAFVASGLALGLVQTKINAPEAIQEQTRLPVPAIVLEAKSEQVPVAEKSAPEKIPEKSISLVPDTSKPNVEKSAFSVVTVSQAVEQQVRESAVSPKSSRAGGPAHEPGFFLVGGQENLCVGVEVLGTKFSGVGDSRRTISEYRLTAQCDQAVGKNLSIVVDGRHVKEISLSRSGHIASVPMSENSSGGFDRFVRTKAGLTGLEFEVSRNEQGLGTPMSTGRTYKRCSSDGGISAKKLVE